MSRRRIFGVIAANVADIEQREILGGIIERAQMMNIDIAVISNIYNPSEPSEVLKTENKIYDLILSDELDGIILISEAIINPDLQQQIKNDLLKKDVPIIVIGTPLPDFVLPNFHFINTSDEADIEDICDHLIDIHRFSDIHILTGPSYLDASHKRVVGYINSLEKHGIAYNEHKIFFGDFWLNSGRAQAQKYISGELQYPQALICCNDYMAYGLLDEFMENDIDVTEKMTVIGYEYIRERRNHSPLLTTYQRNRLGLGAGAVRMLTEHLENGEYGDFSPPSGQIICGDTCSCGAKNEDIKRELKDIQTKATYDFLNLFSQLEPRLTECRNIEEFVARICEFQYMIRGVNKLYMCLYENWYDAAENSENMVCYNLLFHEEPVIFRKNEFSILFRKNAAPYYFCPLFFAERDLGFVVLNFDYPDTLDHIFRNWLKSVANALEFLRMKNDIQYLMQYQSLAENRDTLTGMMNERGLKNAFKSVDKENLYMVGLRMCLFSDSFSAFKENEKIFAVLDAAEAVRQFCGNHDICGKISGDMFLCLVKNDIDADFLIDRLAAIMYQHTAYTNEYGIDSFVCAAVRCGDSYSNTKKDCSALFDSQTKVLSERRLNPHYHVLDRIRRYIYANPQDTFNSEKIYSLFDGSAGYLRAVFRKCYGFTLHDDCTIARIAFVKYCLAVTSMSVFDIAEKCGYTDRKYLMRQFQQETGMTALQYRNANK